MNKSFMTKTVAAAVLAGVSSVSFGFGTGNMPTVPAGWTLKESSTNVRIYQKNGEDTYVQLVDIKGGGKVRLHGTIAGYQTFNGYNEPKFQKKNLATHWTTIPYAGKRAVTNGQFFNPTVDPSMLSFGTRVNGSYLTYGADPGTDTKRTLHIFGDSVSIRAYLATDFNGATSSQAIVGLAPTVTSRGPYLTIGRTMFCGVKERTYITTPGAPVPPSLQDWLLIITAKNKWQYSIIDTDLPAWGCQSKNIVMGDGGGSSQLKTLGGINMYGHASDLRAIVNLGYPDNRPLPHVIVTTDY
jgi:hypothetical protein